MGRVILQSVALAAFAWILTLLLGGLVFRVLIAAGALDGFLLAILGGSLVGLVVAAVGTVALVVERHLLPPGSWPSRDDRGADPARAGERPRGDLTGAPSQSYHVSPMDANHPKTENPEEEGRMNPTTTTAPAPAARAPLDPQGAWDDEQARVNELAGDAASVRAEILDAADRAHAGLPQHEGHRDRWFLGRMAEAHDAPSGEIRADDIVLYVPTPGDRHGSPYTVHSLRLGADVMLPAEAAEALERALEEPPRVEGAPGNPDLVSNVSVDGVVIGSVTRISEDWFVATAYPTLAGAEYTVGAREGLEEAVAAVNAEFEAGWASC